MTADDDDLTAACAADRVAWDAATTDEQRDMCAECPMLVACRDMARDELRRVTSATLHAWDGGVWAGRTLVEWRASLIAPPRQRIPGPLPDSTVRDIRARAAAGAPQREIARTVGVAPSTVSRIVTGRKRSDVPGAATPPASVRGRRANVSDEVAREVRDLAAHGLSTRAIADRLGIPYKTAYRIATGATFRTRPTIREDNAS